MENTDIVIQFDSLLKLVYTLMPWVEDALNKGSEEIPLIAINC